MKLTTDGLHQTIQVWLQVHKASLQVSRRTVKVGVSRRLFTFSFFIDFHQFWKGQKMLQYKLSKSGPVFSVVAVVCVLQSNILCWEQGGPPSLHRGQSKRIWNTQRCSSWTPTASPTEHRGSQPFLQRQILEKSVGILPAGCCHYSLWFIFSSGVFAFKMEPFFFSLDFILVKRQMMK